MKTIAEMRAAVAQWLVATFKKAGVRQWALAALVFLLLGVILLSNVLTERVDLSAGQVAPKDVQAPQRVMNRFLTEQLRAVESDRAVREAADDPSNYVINQAVSVKAKERVGTAYDLLQRAIDQGEGPLDADEIEAVQTELSEHADIELTVGQIGAATRLSPQRLDQLRTTTASVVADILLNARISESNVQQIQAGVGGRIGDLLAVESEEPLSVAEASFAGAIGAQTIEMNLVLDLQRLNRLKEAAVRDVQPIYVERGQMIVRQFDLVTEEHLQILQDLGLLRQRPNYAQAAGLLLLILVLMGLFGNYLYQQKSDLLKNDSHLALLGLILVLVTGISKVASVIPFEGSGYLIPVALGTMLIGILLDVHIAIMAALFLTVVVGIVTGQDFRFVLVALAGSVAGAFSVSKVGERSALARAGFWVGLVNFAAMLGLGLFRSDSFAVRFSFLGIVNGLISAIVTIGLFPYLETVFGITSSIRLLELSNPNQPLLRKLLMEAPGTYHHSMIVGNLAEAAVEAIGGDGLVARVGAQYHDIGKTKRPYFFIENQYGGDNPHDKLAPSLSTLILTSHVKDGVDMAKKYRLPDVVTDFIREHHGTTLARYFFHKAKENAKGEPCDEEDFRYPGPKPRTRESAVVLLADGVEAAVRTLQRPTPGRIEGLVRKIVKDQLADGQLDESNLTLRDLDQIADAFVKVLTGIYHKRIEYPENVLREMEAGQR